MAREKINKKLIPARKILGKPIEYIYVDRVENEADEVHDAAISRLFNNGMKEIDIIKFKDIYDFLESIVDTAEDLANVVEGIVVKHA